MIPPTPPLHRRLAARAAAFCLSLFAGAFISPGLGQENAPPETPAETAADPIAAALAKRDDFARKTEEVGAQLEELSKPPPAVPAPADGATQAELEAGLAGREAELEAERAAGQKLAGQELKRTERLAAIPGEIAALKANADGLPPALAEAEIAKLEAEAAYYRAAAPLLEAERRRAEERATALERARSRWQAAVDAARASDIADTSEAADAKASALAGAPEALAELARGNAELAAQRRELAPKLAEAQAYKAAAAARKARVAEQFSSARKRVVLLESAGLGIDRETARLLRAQRAALPGAADARRDLKVRLRESAEAELRRIRLEAARAGEDLGDLDARATELASWGVGATEAKALLEERRHLYDSLSADLLTYSQALAAGNEEARLAAEESEAYARYLDERLLWTASADRVHRSDLAAEGEALTALGDLGEGGLARAWLEALGADAVAQPVFWLAAAALVGWLSFRRRRYRTFIDEAGAAAARRNCTGFAPTAKALAYTLLLAAPSPLALAFLAWRTAAPEAFAAGLTAAAAFAAPTCFARAASRPRGLLESHFRFAPERASVVHGPLLWFLPFGGTTAFLAAALPSAGESPAGRIAFIAFMVLLAAVFHRTLKPDRGLVPGRRRAKLLFAAGLSAPLVLAAAAAFGYLSSAAALRDALLGTLWWVLLAFFVSSLLLRWILVSRRRLAIDQALQRREAAAAERAAAEGEAAAKADPDTLSLEEVKARAVDVVVVEEQTRRLVRLAGLVLAVLGLWGIWSPLLPALSVLDKVPLWPGSGSPAAAAPADASAALVGQAPTSTPAAGPGPEEKGIADISLADLLFALLLFALTAAAAKNIPGLLELTVLRRLDLGAGSSFAITTTARYLIIIGGAAFALAQIGITWSKVQWVAAAITLGIGFGLQEVFANFVAGLILLYERPFRLGDVVTVGTVSGRVTQIRMRATTVRQFDNRELIVPNKEFITGQLVNWTLSDNMLRIEIPVGIAYGSDTRLAERTLLRLAAEHPKILEEPAPQVIFTAFGDSALLFELRAHVAQVDDNLATKNELFFQIDDAFREAGIEIAFPQVDLHVRSMPT